LSGEQFGFSPDFSISEKVIMKTMILSVFLGLFFSTWSEAIDLTASGGLMRVVNSSHLVAGAGSKLVTTFDDAAATTLAIANTSGSSDHWRIDVKRSDTTWNSALRLYVKRISDGSGNGAVTGGLFYVEITGSEIQLFSGAGDRSGLTLSYELTGMSVAVPPNMYSTTVTFTVVDTP
jgi:hypothetical protein